VINHVKSQLKDVQKGWFNLEETNTEVYNFSKLKKFLSYLNFIMQDSMRDCMLESLGKFQKYIDNACKPIVTVNSISSATIDYSGGGQLTPAKTEVRQKKIPLFVVDLVIDGEGKNSVFAYSSPSTAFTDTVLQYFDKSLQVVLKLTRIERRVMKVSHYIIYSQPPAIPK